MAASISGVRQTNLKPTARSDKPGPCACFGGRGGSARNQTATAHPTKQIAANAKERGPLAARKTPPIAGPATEAVSKMLLFHATALGKSLAGTNCGISAAL